MGLTLCGGVTDPKVTYNDLCPVCYPCAQDTISHLPAPFPHFIFIQPFGSCFCLNCLYFVHCRCCHTNFDFANVPSCLSFGHAFPFSPKHVPPLALAQDPLPPCNRADPCNRCIIQNNFRGGGGTKDTVAFTLVSHHQW